MRWAPQRETLPYVVSTSNQNSIKHIRDDWNCALQLRPSSASFAMVCGHSSSSSASCQRQIQLPVFCDMVWHCVGGLHLVFSFVPGWGAPHVCRGYGISDRRDVRLWGSALLPPCSQQVQAGRAVSPRPAQKILAHFFVPHFMPRQKRPLRPLARHPRRPYAPTHTNIQSRSLVRSAMDDDGL